MIQVKIVPCTYNIGDLHIKRIDTDEFWGHTSPSINAPTGWVIDENKARYYNNERGERPPKNEIAKHSDWQLIE